MEDQLNRIVALPVLPFQDDQLGGVDAVQLAGISDKPVFGPVEPVIL